MKTWLDCLTSVQACPARGRRKPAATKASLVAGQACAEPIVDSLCVYILLVGIRRSQHQYWC
jgi:hypothetical protein